MQPRRAGRPERVRITGQRLHWVPIVGLWRHRLVVVGLIRPRFAQRLGVQDLGVDRPVVSSHQGGWVLGVGIIGDALGTSPFGAAAALKSFEDGLIRLLRDLDFYRRLRIQSGSVRRIAHCLQCNGVGHALIKCKPEQPSCQRVCGLLQSSLCRCFYLRR